MTAGTLAATGAMRKSMTEPGAVVLFSCYELGHQPMGVAMPAAFLRRVGFAPVLHDVAVERFDPAWVTAARFVGIAVPMHTALRLGMRLAKRVRAVNPACVICFYGLYAGLNADYLLSHGVDFCIAGECEEPLTALVQALDAGAASRIPGVSAVEAPAGAHLERLKFPVPARDGLQPLAAYAKLVHDGAEIVAGYVEASRGCKHRCLHCPITPIYDGRFFVVPRDVVLADITQQVEAGAGHITFGDPDFLNGPRHAMAVARELHAAFPHVTFDITAKVEHLLTHRDLLPELRELGCLFIVSAVESFSDVVLANLHKGHTRADALEAFAVARKAGIALRPSFVPFTPWTSAREYVDMLDIIRREGLIDAVDAVQYSIRLLVPPGSALVAHDAIQPFLGPVDDAALTHTWTHPDPRMDDLHRSVSERVEAAACADEEPGVTFNAVHALACEAAGLPVRIESSPEVYRARARVPHLTESWFC